MIDIYDLNDFPYSIKHASYGGLTGSKDGIMIQDESWLVKYPQNLSNMKGDVPSYSTSPLSEYIGSHIFDILGYDVHETILGIRNNKLVVACKDFADNGKMLLEIRTIKNSYNQNLIDTLDKIHTTSTDSHIVDIDELMVHLDMNPILSSISEIKERFFEQALIDVFIANTDRNNGNWGILREFGKSDTLAPIFDNGSSFLSKTTELKLDNILQSSEFNNNSTNILTAYGKCGHHFSAKTFFDYFKDNVIFQNAVLKITPLIKNKMPEIIDLICTIPESIQLKNGEEISVMSKLRKIFYIKQLETRIELLFQPLYDSVFRLNHNDIDLHEDCEPEP